MDDRKREDDTVVSTEVKDTESNLDTERVESTGAPVKKTANKYTYAISFVILVIIGFGLVFLLERDGRINTNLFTGIIAEMEAKKPAAKVNGTVIPMSDLNSGVKQLSEAAKAQGQDAESEAAIKQFQDQAIDSLVNGEILRQKAKAEGFSTTTEAIDSRYNEIQTSIGGAEALVAKMAEFGVTEANLRRDIENEIIIQALFDSVVDKDSLEVTEEEIKGFYDQAGGAAAGIPPLEEVRDQIVQQIKQDKEQQQINDYVEKLKTDAKIEILI